MYGGLDDVRELCLATPGQPQGLTPMSRAMDEHDGDTYRFATRCV